MARFAKIGEQVRISPSEDNVTTLDDQILSFQDINGTTSMAIVSGEAFQINSQYPVVVDNGTSFRVQSTPSSPTDVVRLEDLDDYQVKGITNEKLKAWANSGAYALTSVSYNSDDAITTASVAWPDGGTGTFTTDTFSTNFLGQIDAFHITYVPAIGPTKTITQSLLTRDANGLVTAQPDLTIV